MKIVQDACEAADLLNASDQTKKKSIIEFEKRCLEIKQQRCDLCRSVSLRLIISSTVHGNICGECKNNKVWQYENPDSRLPIWYNDEKIPQYTVPEELSCLREAEKLLISQVSVYIPLQHLSLGQLGAKGHVCCFEKDLSDICTTLPRLPSDVTVVRILRKFTNDEGEVTSKAFSIRKKEVLDALRWLQKYNALYQNITIAEENLDWIEDGKEQELPGKVHIENNDPQHPSTLDMGPAPLQNIPDDVNISIEEESCGAMQITMHDDNLSKTNQQISDALKKATQKTNTVSWPYSTKEALSEYGSNTNLFCKAFPWLFPGGLGDFSQYREGEETIEKWAKRMLLYEDGRFAKDKMWCFYVLNVSNRRANQSSGAFFVNNWFKSGQQTLDEIRRDIKAGNTKWIDKITYYSKRIRGSSAFWKAKREEVYTWINHHVNAGNGPPNFFITLSCAEYHWKDIKRLIQERFTIAGLPPPDLNRKYVELINDYTIVVQEYFQQRVEEWLQTVGKTIFKIKHYWLRYEFAPSRGQIHAHMLAISDHQKSLERCFNLYGNNREKQAQFLSTWAQKSLGMTCNLPIPKEHIDSTKENNPAKKYFFEVEEHMQDQAECLYFFQQHICSAYCLRKRKQTGHNEDRESKRRRVCRNGAGIETKPDSGITEGYQIRTDPAIVNDLRNFLRLELPRSDRRTTQTSSYMLQSWRANCDIQLLVYESSYSNPDLAEIAKITDYIVAYTCKGNETTLKEKENLKQYILNLPEDLACQNLRQESAKIARMVLNRALKDKVVSKQECMVHLNQMPLYQCSEIIQTVSISGAYRIDPRNSKGQSFYDQYSKRTAEHYGKSMDEYFHFKKNNNNNKTVIPHFVGGKNTPCYPPTESYAKSTMITYFPWHGKFEIEGRNFIEEFNKIILHPTCPKKVKIPFERIKHRVISKTVHIEPTSQSEKVNFANFSYDMTEENNDLVDAVATFQTENEEENYYSNFDRGLDFDWSIPHIPIPNQKNPQTWLTEQIEASSKSNKTEQNPYGLPTKHDGQLYTLDASHGDQRDILGYIFSHIHKWVETEYTNNVSPKPLHMTIAGVAGSGKSTLINTLVSTIRSFFQSEKSAKVCGPTGSAAFNAGGLTCHHAFHLPVNNPYTQTVGEKTIKSVRQSLDDLICLVIDERSMISSEVIATMESRARIAANNGNNTIHEWGNIPIIILVGDDFQLPSIQNGMLQTMEKEYYREYLCRPFCNNKKIADQEGERIFNHFAQDVMYLQTSKRQHKDQTYFKDLLQKARAEEDKQQLSSSDAHFLCSFHLQQPHFSEEEKKKILENPQTLFLYSTNEGVDKCNETKLHEQHSSINPVAFIKAQSKNKHGATISNNSKHFRDDNVLSTTMLCRGAKVHLYGKNLKPEWGLYNGSIGKVVDIVYQKGCSPNTNDLPQYTLVEFPQYKGPPFLENHPKIIPIVPVTHVCKTHCCTKTFLPLALSYAKTIHKFQGQNAGPTPPGHPENAVQILVCDPGKKEFESRNPGLFYTLLSRATTIGQTNDRTTSAIFFDGPNMQPNRILNITQNKTGYESKKVILRNLWVKKLQQNSHSSGMTPQEIENLFIYMSTNTYNPSLLIHKFI